MMMGDEIIVYPSDEAVDDDHDLLEQLSRDSMDDDDEQIGDNDVPLVDPLSDSCGCSPIDIDSLDGGLSNETLDLTLSVSGDEADGPAHLPDFGVLAAALTKSPSDTDVLSDFRALMSLKSKSDEANLSAWSVKQADTTTNSEVSQNFQPLPTDARADVPSLPDVKIMTRDAPANVLRPDAMLAGPDNIEVTPPCPSQTTENTDSSSTNALLERFLGAVIINDDMMDLIACPCSQQSCFEDTTVKDPIAVPEPEPTEPPSSEMQLFSPSSRSLALFSSESDDQDDLDDFDNMTGVLPTGVYYQLTRILAEGLLHKKGTGRDFFGSRSWKVRWARLALGKVEGHGDIAVPLLCISWYATSAVNSTVIILDSTVVLAVDLPGKDQWNTFRFEIRHATSKENTSLPVTRTFTASSRKARDAWVYAISQALYSYEKEKAAVSKHQRMKPSTKPRRRPKSPRSHTPPKPKGRVVSPLPLSPMRRGMESPPRPPRAGAVGKKDSRRGRALVSPPPLVPPPHSKFA